MAETAGKTNLSQVPGASETLPEVEVETWYDTMAGVMGNVLEWYDFALFGFFSGRYW
jgi:hypothetical protein